MRFEKNIGPKNRTARLIAGIVLIILSLYFIGQGWLPILGIIVGLFLILEAAFSYCVVHGIRGTKDMR